MIVAVVLGVLAVALAVLAVCARLLFLVVTVVGASMEPAYRAGDRLLSRRWAPHRVGRGDVVVLNGAVTGVDLPPQAMSYLLSRQEGRLVRFLVKRVTAVPGDPVPEVVVPALTVPADVVPPGRLVVLGDNWRTSADSRVFGFVAADQVVAVVIRRLSGRQYG
ncbi:S26 family signal peptidase [Sphaerisporangium corydalis]|uniref:S26 family signal peptidase n=1 Tax=Sphaerisporangium corydalis TaxID=1441875 RepID=A0ABV9ENP4_9ACTN|nr:S26 family signal peptidase [Sphaerisporangium corydalis]